MLSSSKSREPAVHICPWFIKIADIVPPTAVSKSQSAKTMFGDLPPNSSETFLAVPAAKRMISRPVSVPPVKLIISTRESVTRSRAASLSLVATIFTTPAGNPLSLIICAKRMTDAQPTDDGLKTTVFPASNAGAIFHAAMIKG